MVRAKDLTQLNANASQDSFQALQSPFNQTHKGNSTINVFALLIGASSITLQIQLNKNQLVALKIQL